MPASAKGESIDNSPIFGPNAPTKEFSQPLNGEELLVTEIAAYLPRYPSSYDFAKRLTNNGLTRRPYTNMVKYFRKSYKDSDEGSIGRMTSQPFWDLPKYKRFKGTKAN
ncbi:hypothetical protein E8E11_010717 [Didymella keratinophila]|nr:hypothetical protein E8E11_010717 [Didymella keratinophila]